MKETVFRRRTGRNEEMIGSLVFPVVFYLLLSMSITGLLQMIIPAFSNASAAMWLLTLANALQIPVFGLMYRRDRERSFCGKRNGIQGCFCW